MDSELKPVFTSEGSRALLDAYRGSARLCLKHVVIGSGNREMQRAAVSGGEFIGGDLNQLRLSATIRDGDGNVPELYPINNIGFILENGALFAVYSGENRIIAEKLLDSDVALTFELEFRSKPTALNPAALKEESLYTELRMMWMSPEQGLMGLQVANYSPFPPNKLKLITP